jgi:hypothetical protein
MPCPSSANAQAYASVSSAKSIDCVSPSAAAASQNAARLDGGLGFSAAAATISPPWRSA